MEAPIADNASLSPDAQVAAAVAARMKKEGVLDSENSKKLAEMIAAGKATASEWAVFFRGCINKKEEEKKP